MPAIKVFEFAQRIKDYVRIGLNHTNWIVDSILVFYSTRSKQTKFGYKVVPLYVGVIAYDTAENRTTNCRIQFDDLCTIVAPSTGHSIPYISVSTGAKDNRAIFETGITYLKIDCAKTGIIMDIHILNTSPCALIINPISINLMKPLSVRLRSV